MTDAARVETLIVPSVEALGYEVVRVQISGQARPTLQIMIERSDRATMTVEDCAEVSRAVSAILDGEDPVSVAYTLEVSSPGIDRPLTRPKHFERFAGFEARLETRVPIDGRMRFKGRLRGLDEGAVAIDTQEGPARIPFEDLTKAKLVLTDELIEAMQAGPR
ncbi:MAG: ribosome maturation factor RimP [Rhodospirillales bacterium]